MSCTAFHLMRAAFMGRWRRHGLEEFALPLFKYTSAPAVLSCYSAHGRACLCSDPNSAVSASLSEVSIARSSQDDRRCGGNLCVCACVCVYYILSSSEDMVGGLVGMVMVRVRNWVMYYVPLNAHELWL